MTWEQKFEAMQSLAEASLCMRKPGDWYVKQNIEVGGNGMLIGEYGNGITPELAVEDHWNRLTAVKAPMYLTIRAYGTDRRQYRWNGYRWADVPVRTEIEKKRDADTPPALTIEQFMARRLGRSYKLKDDQ